MGFNGTGDFVRNDGTLTGAAICQTQAATSVGIQPVRFDNELNEIASALEACVTKDGQTGALTADQDFGGNKATNLGAATANGQAIRYEQLGWVDFASSALVTAVVGSGSISTALVTHYRYYKCPVFNVVEIRLGFDTTITGSVSQVSCVLPFNPLTGLTSNQSQNITIEDSSNAFVDGIVRFFDGNSRMQITRQDSGAFREDALRFTVHVSYLSN